MMKNLLKKTAICQSTYRPVIEVGKEKQYKVKDFFKIT
jgi:hypothetical protein